MNIAVFAKDGGRRDALQRQLAECLRMRDLTCETGLYADAELLLRDVKARRVDLAVFLLPAQADVEMDAARCVRMASLACEILFVADTAAYVPDAMPLRAVGYLSAPADAAELGAALQRVIRQRTDIRRKYVVHTRRSDILVEPARILYFRSEGHYVNVYIDGEMQPLAHLARLDDVQREMAGMGCVRIHQSYLVNAGAVCGVSGRNIVLKDGTQLPVSRRYAHLLQTFAQPCAAAETAQ